MPKLDPGISNEKSLNGLLHNLLEASVLSCMFLQDLAEIFYKALCSHQSLLSVKMYICLLTLSLQSNWKASVRTSGGTNVKQNLVSN